jgi:hypothetical protein
LATITNVIKTIFQSLGADDVVNNTNRVGRAQTRLGQQSASSGRAFAAQASGLGGLVAAYAGAAATTFALQQAFVALTTAARAAQTIEGLGALSAIAGQDGKAILSSIQEITKGQITLTEAAQQANLSLSAGFNTKQIEGLAEVATKASRALGRDLNDAYTRVVRGSAKLETELLDELGIYTKIEPATRAYAAAIGKARTELTEYERRQAFVNAVIEEGTRKFSSINTTIPTSAEQLEAFGATVINISTQFGSFVADKLAPLAAYLTTNVASAFAAVGIAASLVAGKAITLLTAGFAAFNEKVVKAGATTEKIIRAFTLTAAAADKANNSIKALTASQVKLTGTQATQLTGLIDASQNRKLNTLELKESRKLINQNITALKTERDAFRASARAAIDAQRTAQSTRRAALAQQQAALTQLKDARDKPQGGGFGTAEFIARTTAINQANAALRRANTAVASNSAVIAANSAAYTAATTQVRANTAALAANRVALTALGPALTGVGAKLAAFGAGIVAVTTSLITGFGALFKGLLGLGSSILFFGSLFTLLGGSIATALGKGEEFNAFVSDLGATVKQFFSNDQAVRAKKVFKGVTVGALAELEKTNAALRDTDTFTFRKKFLFFEVEVEKTKEDLVNEVNSIISEVATGSQQTFTEALVGPGALIGGAIGAILPALLSFIPGIGPVAALLGGTFARGFTVAAAAGVGAFIDSTLFTNEFDPDSDVAKRLRTQFANALIGFDEEIQNQILSGLAELENRYGEAATTDPRARITLRVQKELLLASGEYLSNMESVSQLMQAIGQTSDVVAKNFRIAGSETLGEFIEIEKSISRTNENLTVSFISIDKLLENLDTIRTGPRGDREIRGIPDIEAELTSAVEAVNSFNRSLALTDFTQTNLNTAIREGSITLEQYEQGIGAVISAQSNSFQEYFRTRQEIATLETEIGTLINPDQKNAANAILAQLQTRLTRTSDLLTTQQQLTKELEDQKSVLEAQNTISEFLKISTENRKNILSLDLEFSLAGTTDPIDRLTTELSFYSAFLNDVGAEATNLFNTNREQLRTLALDTATISRILTTPSAKLSDLAADLSEELKGFTFEDINGELRITQSAIESYSGTVREAAEATVTLQRDGVASIILINEQTIERIKNTVQTAIEALPQFIDRATQDYQDIIKKIDSDLKQLASREQTLAIQFNIDKRNLEAQFADIRFEGLISKLEDDIETIEARRSLGQISPVDAAKQVAGIEQQIIEQRQTALRDALMRERDNLTDREAILKAESEIRKQAIRDEAQAQIDKIVQDVAYVNTIVQAYDTFIKDSDAVNNKLVQDFVRAGNIVADTIASTLRSGGTSIATAIQAALLKQFSGQAPAVQGGTGSISTQAISTTLATVGEDFDALSAKTIGIIREGERARIQAETNATDRALELIALEREAVDARYEEERNALTRAKDLGNLAAQQRLKDIAEEQAKKDKTRAMIEELFNSIQSSIETAITGVSNFILYGEGNLGDIFGNLFKSIQQDFFKTTIAKPLSNALTSSLFGALGVDVTTGIENAQVRNGALLVEIVEGPSDFFKEAFKDSGEGGFLSNLFGGVSDFFSGLFGKNGVVANLFTGLFGSGGLFSSIFTGFGDIFSNLFGGVGSIFSSIFKGVFGLFGMAQGGMVHMASGGQLRDRVPAMLEPGEFVIRKPMAREIGTPALQALNATGQIPASAPVINFKNEGTPKSVEADQPRFDGEKYVIDIITRDLANNGPIRRTLRSGNL